MLVRIDHSIISPGTELAFLHAAAGTSGVFPQWSGYSSFGRVVARGPGVEHPREGDAVVVDALHASAAITRADNEACQIAPTGVDGREAAAFGLVTIALQGVRKTQVQLGQSVLVIIGNLAGQLAGPRARRLSPAPTPSLAAGAGPALRV